MNRFNRAASTTKKNKQLLVLASRSLNFGEQTLRAAALHQWCDSQALCPDSKILVAVQDELEQASILLGLISSGVTPLILDPQGTAFETRAILDASDVDAVIATKDLHHHWALSDYNLPWLEVELAPTKGVFSRLLNKRKTAVNETSWPAIADKYTEYSYGNFEEDSLAYVVFTSGTTSRPKGVEVTHTGLTSQMATLEKQYRLNDNSRILNTLPMHHVDGLLQGILLAWFSGITLFRPYPFSVQNLQAYMDSIYRERITHLIAVPTMLSLLHRLGREWSDAFSGEDFQFIVSCAGHLEQALWESLESDFKSTVVNMYGLTETGTSALFSGPDTESRAVGTLGIPVNCSIRILDEDNSPVAKGQPGELWISGPQLMSGYHKNPAATAQVMTDGWFRTGDLVCELESGHLSLHGRKKNQIISGGRNISPEEITAVLNLHTGVDEAVVMGMPEADWGEMVIALVVPNTPDLGDGELTSWCRNNLSEYKIPKEIIFVEHLPKGPSGKIRLELAKQLYLDHASTSDIASSNNDMVSDKLRSIAAQIFRLRSDDLPSEPTIKNTKGWDSLAHMELMLAIESAFNIQLSARDIMQIDSLSTAREVVLRMKQQ